MPDVATLTIRPYEVDDADASRACVVELQDAERQIDSRLRTGDAMADDYFRQMLERCRDCALVAELVVRAGFRGQAIDRALLTAGERHAHESGATELRIGVRSNNHPARQLYIRDGFAPYSEILAKPLTPSVHREAAT